MRLFAKTRARAAARRTYWAIDRDLHHLHRRLGRAVMPAERARLLSLLAVAQYEQARVHDSAFGVDEFPADHNDPSGDMATSMRWSSTLYRLLSDVERSVDSGNCRSWVGTELEPTAGAVLDRMAATSSLTGRMALLGDLHEAVYPVVGGQAGETVWCLPWPGKPARAVADVEV